MIVAKVSWDLKPAFKEAFEVDSVVGIFIPYQSLNYISLETLEYSLGNFLLTFMMSARLHQKFKIVKY